MDWRMCSALQHSTWCMHWHLNSSKTLLTNIFFAVSLVQFYTIYGQRACTLDTSLNIILYRPSLIIGGKIKYMHSLMNVFQTVYFLCISLKPAQGVRKSPYLHWLQISLHGIFIKHRVLFLWKRQNMDYDRRIMHMYVLQAGMRTN